MKPIYKEHSTYVGLGLVVNGIADCVAGNYQSGILNIIGGLFGILKREGIN